MDMSYTSTTTGSTGKEKENGVGFVTGEPQWWK
jgi:hypothetical protein